MRDLDVDDAPIGCRDPARGREVTRRLGEALPAGLRQHVAGCLACQVERRAYERFVGDPAIPSGIEPGR